MRLIPRLFALLALSASAALAAVPQAGTRPDYVPDRECLGCHTAQAGRWADSKHAHAMAQAGPRTVLGDFAAAHFSGPGEQARFVRHDGRYFVVTEDAGGQPAEFPVDYTFGVRPLQQVLLPLPGGRLQAFTLAWDTGRKQWFSLHPDGAVPAGSNLHWTGRYQNWNMMCGECHTTAYRKGYDDRQDSYRTTWAESNVGCQACHGGGRAHVDSARALAHAGNAKGAPVRTPNQALYAERAGGPAQVDQCAACHARRTRLVEQTTPGAPLLDNFIPDNLRADLYHADGQQMAEVFEYGSFRQSRMYQAGVACTNCHEPHSGALRAPGNSLCLQCHTPTPDTRRFPGLKAKHYDAPEHHFHTPGSAGAQCVACHMPSQNYMVVHARRDHAIRIPRPDLTRTIGTPNACQNCHADKGAEWAEAAIERHHGKHARPEHYGQILAAARRGEATAIPRLAALIADTTQPAIVRATALETWARRNPGPVPAAALADPDPVVRASAALAVAARPATERLAQLPPLLTDPRRAVRITAARGLVDLPDSRLAPASVATRRAAMAALTAARQAMADMPSVQLDMAAIALAQRDVTGAETHYRRALEREPALQPARLGLAALLSATERTDAAVELLRAGLAKSPAPGQLHLALGLLAGQQGQWEAAARELREAVRLMPEHVQARRNLYAVERYLARTDARARE
ncbi:tetratricopeptide repeat protein [Nitrogeniibacter mangrovi]|uniref:Tetratricopeptide repeat protein n=1 Tax=Nitrogeniibacter mangrovi TaxID=2016596 RepID=A0A6C1B1T5_9RHOO|nr:multiheme c-type cytochrome [Nitrogeniibacter mangrovi]QID16234.1 tetratricopeptide repeat protein [Nitrogeniibacter mangrovi]